jgi:HEPN domain-containing protein
MRFSPKAKSSTVQPHERWLARAEDDLSFAQLGLREKYYSQVCFLSQQVVEKAFKAFLLAKGRTYPRLHKVIELANLCFELRSELDPLKIDLKLLDEFYIPTRYPDAVPGGLPTGLPEFADAQAALAAASKILELVRIRI